MGNNSLNKEYERKYTSIDSIHFETVIDGLHKVVERGTAKVAKIKGIDIQKNGNRRKFY